MGDNAQDSSSSSVCDSSWQSLIDQLHSMKEFCVHTGNINNYLELKLKRFANSAEELSACLDLQFSNLPEDVKISDNGMLLLADKKHQRMEAYDRDDLKITLKLFVEEFNFSFVYDAIQATLSQLGVSLIEQLIVAFPQPNEPEENTEDSNTSEFDAKWFARVLGLWTEIEEKLVNAGLVMSVGVADFHLAPLQRLYDAVKVKPCVDHFNIDGCCVVPPELQQYARENDIQLLTHNDPHPFPLKQIFKTFCSNQKEADLPRSSCCTIFEPLWAGRYTIWVRRRSLMAAKGYIVQFSRANVSN